MSAPDSEPETPAAPLHNPIGAPPQKESGAFHCLPAVDVPRDRRAHEPQKVERRLALRSLDKRPAAHEMETDQHLREKEAEKPYAFFSEKGGRSPLQLAKETRGSGDTRCGSGLTGSPTHASTTAAPVSCSFKQPGICLEASSELNSSPAFQSRLSDWTRRESSFTGAPQRERSNEEPAQFPSSSPSSSLSSSSAFSSPSDVCLPDGGSSAFSTSGAAGAGESRDAPLDTSCSPSLLVARARTSRQETPEPVAMRSFSSVPSVSSPRSGSAPPAEEKTTVDLGSQSRARLCAPLVEILASAKPTEREALRRSLHSIGREQGLRPDEIDCLFLSVLFRVPAFLRTAATARAARAAQGPNGPERLAETRDGDQREIQRARGDTGAREKASFERVHFDVCETSERERKECYRSGSDFQAEGESHGKARLWEGWRGNTECESIFCAQGRAVLCAVRTLQHWALSHPLHCHASALLPSRFPPLRHTVAWILQAALELLVSEGEANLKQKVEVVACRGVRKENLQEWRDTAACAQRDGRDGQGICRDGRGGEGSGAFICAEESARRKNAVSVQLIRDLEPHSSDRINGDSRVPGKGRQVAVALLQRLFLWSASPHPPLQALAASLWRQVGLSTRLLSKMSRASSPLLSVRSLAARKNGESAFTGVACGSLNGGNSAKRWPIQGSRSAITSEISATGPLLHLSVEQRHEGDEDEMEEREERREEARELRRVSRLGEAAIRLLDCLFLLATRPPQWGVFARDKEAEKQVETRGQHGDSSTLRVRPGGCASGEEARVRRRGDSAELHDARGPERCALSPLLRQFAPSPSQRQLLQCLGVALESASEETQREILSSRVLPYAVHTISFLKQGVSPVNAVARGDDVGGRRNEDGRDGKAIAPERSKIDSAAIRKAEIPSSVLTLLEILHNLPVSLLAPPAPSERKTQDSHCQSVAGLSGSEPLERGCISLCDGLQKSEDTGDGSSGCTDTVMGCLDSLLEALLEIAFDRAVTQQNRKVESRSDFLKDLSVSLERRVEDALHVTREAFHRVSVPLGSPPLASQSLGSQQHFAGSPETSAPSDASQASRAEHLNGGSGRAPPADVAEKARSLLTPDRMCEALRGVHTPEVDEERMAVELVCRLCTSVLSWRDSLAAARVLASHSVELSSFLEHYLCTPQRGLGFLSWGFRRSAKGRSGRAEPRGTTTSLLFAAALAVCCCTSVDAERRQVGQTPALEGDEAGNGAQGARKEHREGDRDDRHIERLWWVVEAGLGPMLQRHPDFLLRVLMNAIVFVGVHGGDSCGLLSRLLGASETAATLLESCCPRVPVRCLRACISAFQFSQQREFSSPGESASSTQAAASAEEWRARRGSLSLPGGESGAESGRDKARRIGRKGGEEETREEEVKQPPESEEGRKQHVWRWAEAALRRGSLGVSQETSESAKEEVEKKEEAEMTRRERGYAGEGMDFQVSGPDAKRRKTETETRKLEVKREAVQMYRHPNATGDCEGDAGSFVRREQKEEGKEDERRETEEAVADQNRGETRGKKTERAEREKFLRSILQRLDLTARKIEEYHGFEALALRDCVALLDEELLDTT
ncbi:hypothetical protein TGPRC2_311740 [Toxoplasma gondii TgCatPRC2]|uniref:Uncharacterized protein n=1 Tax=Toxoplasma gondii TgCatPRC2 TaxID=1130821 RepID=A0A151HKL3_TOXGO|nr:hypothetical protein TGPRC2_311740 [Toxoplasma gondii TgCatPRC2]